jgi:hypothetical protein
MLRLTNKEQEQFYAELVSMSVEEMLFRLNEYNSTLKQIYEEIPELLNVVNKQKFIQFGKLIELDGLSEENVEKFRVGMEGFDPEIFHIFIKVKPIKADSVIVVVSPETDKNYTNRPAHVDIFAFFEDSLETKKNMLKDKLITATLEAIEMDIANFNKSIRKLELSVIKIKGD